MNANFSQLDEKQKLDNICAVWSALYLNLIDDNMGNMLNKFSKIYLDVENEAAGDASKMFDVFSKRNEELCSHLFNLKIFTIYNLDKFKRDIFNDTLLFIDKKDRDEVFSHIEELVDTVIDDYMRKYYLADINLDKVKQICEMQERMSCSGVSNEKLVGFSFQNGEYIVNPFNCDNPFEYYGRENMIKFIIKIEDKMLNKEKQQNSVEQKTSDVNVINNNVIRRRTR